MKTTPLATAVAWLAAAAPALALDLNENLSLGVTIAAVGQCQNVSTAGAPDTCRGAVPFQIEGAFRPAEGHELGFKLGLAAGNVLNPASPFALAPWAADLEDDVQDINGRGRDYLRAAWYRYQAQLAEDSTVAASIGILDTTEYLDGNEYANDEYTQFMNEVFVNAGTYGLPSYDTGAAVQWELGAFSLSAVVMRVGENDDGNVFNFYGAQVGYHVETDLGAGNYRLILAGTSDDFLDPTGTRNEGRLAGSLSFDQALGDVVGAFLRLAWQDGDALVDYDAIYSGGLNLAGAAWGREADNIGIGYACLAGGNADLDHTQVFETYYRFGLTDAVAITADLQWMQDDYRAGADAEDHDGWIFGLRFTAAF
jgi:porin